MSLTHRTYIFSFKIYALTNYHLKLFKGALHVMAENTLKDKSGKKGSQLEPTSSEIDESATGNMEALRKYFAEKLGFSDDETDSKKPKVLNENTIDGVAQYIKDKKCKNIITMAGAGISTCMCTYYKFSRV